MVKHIDSNAHEQKIIIRVSVISILVNALLVVLKLIAGVVASSSAMISDAVHSASDILTTVVVIIGAKISKKAPDKNHPYGHEKFEAIATTILSLTLIITAMGIAYQALTTLYYYFFHDLIIPIPGRLALIAALVSIGLKEAMYWFTYIYGKRVKSTAMVADAWHHRSDAMSSVGSLIGVGAAMLGYVFFDPIAALLIAFIVFHVAIKILRQAVDHIVDKSPNEEIQQAIKAAILRQKGVIHVDELRIRMHVEKMFVDCEIAVDENLSLQDAHDISECVHDAIEDEFCDVKHCMIHVNPYKINKKSSK